MNEAESKDNVSEEVCLIFSILKMSKSLVRCQILAILIGLEICSPENAYLLYDIQAQFINGFVKASCIKELVNEKENKEVVSTT